MDWMKVSEPIVMWAILIVFNIAVIQLLRSSLKGINLQQAVSEKVTAPDSPPETSYSRVAGMVGAVVLACFVWALGNVVIFKAFTNVDQVTTLLGGLGSFFLAGASLFAPYAFNQLSSAFK